MNLSFPLHATFVALPLEQKAKWQFQAMQEELKEYEDILRFQNPSTPHITLQYWKEVMEIEFHQIQTQMKKIVGAATPFVLHATEVGTFGDHGNDRVLFLEIGFSEELARLKKSCPWPSGQPFHPHITLARIRHPQKFAVHKKNIMKALRDCSFDIPVDRLRLYANIDGASQTPLEDVSFSHSSS